MAHTHRVRIIVDPPGSAAFNMAADQHLLERCREDRHTVFVRLYRWATPTVTLGRLQDPAENLSLEQLEKDGVDWIRRPTGGRAVLHHNDITYSCIFSTGIKEMKSTITETYQVISHCLMKGLTAVGIHCTPHESVLDTDLIRRDVKLPCFLAPNREELMVEGKKLVGSAQKRSAHGVLQHGSIPLGGEFRNLPRYLNLPAEQRRLQRLLLSQKCCCIQELWPDFDPHTLVTSFGQSFARYLPGNAEFTSWSHEEKSMIEHEAGSDSFVSAWLT